MNSTVGPGHYKLKPYLGTYDGAEKKINKSYMFEDNL